MNEDNKFMPNGGTTTKTREEILRDKYIEFRELMVAKYGFCHWMAEPAWRALQELVTSEPVATYEGHTNHLEFLQDCEMASKWRWNRKDFAFGAKLYAFPVLPDVLTNSYVAKVEAHQDRVIVDGSYHSVEYIRKLIAADAAAARQIESEVKP